MSASIRPSTATPADDAARLAKAWDNRRAKKIRDAAIRERCSDMATVTMVVR